MSWFDGDIHGETLTVHQVATGRPDANGRATGTPVDTVLTGYSVVPVGSTESVGNEKVITARYRVSGPLTDVVEAHDRVTWRGTAYQVDGHPQLFVGAFPHTEFFLKLDRG